MGSSDLLTTFCCQAEAMGAQTLCVAEGEKAADRIIASMRPLGSRVALVASPLVEEIGLEEALAGAEFEVEKEGRDFARHADIGIVEFDLGIAETGTLVHDATDLKKRLASMLPLHCVALLRSGKVVPDMAEALSFYLKSGQWPGYLAMVTGPSRTADIERSLTIGVHGPEGLLIVLLG
ncbi:MAG: lactate utilization protein [Thermoanaerobacteraceae bacterium]|nr:lactate utilization protein [Thermoanaerobacteraceae bacterium]